MRSLGAIALNKTDSAIELCKLSLPGIKLAPGEQTKLQFTAVGTIHGHSDIGSFVINKHYGAYVHNSWGQLKLNVRETETDYIFEITTSEQKSG